MAKPSERRVNKAFIIPSDTEVTTDPSATDVTGDHRYDAIEDLRVERAIEAAQLQQSDEPPSGRDLLSPSTDPGVIESMQEARWEAEQAADVESHAEKVDDLRGEWAATGLDSNTPTIDTTGTDDVTPSNYP